MQNPKNANGRSRILLAFVTAAISLVLTAPVFAATYYVAGQDSRASDTNPGTESLPWKTLYSISNANLQPGDTVYVKPGNYQVTGGTWASPAINPRNSGTKDKPITIKALPRHGAIVRATGDGPALGSKMRHYIVIDGFVITSSNPKGVAVFGNSYTDKVVGVVIQNNIVRDIYYSHPTDNTDGIRVENSSNVVVRNNLIYNIHNGTTSHNAAGVKLYRADHTLIENNEVYDSGSGIFDKAAGESNVIRRNLVHDCGYGFLVSNDVSIATRNTLVYENIANKCRIGAGSTQVSGSVVDNVKIYNNVFANYRDAGMHPIKFGPGKFRMWNNIFYRTAAPAVADFYTYNDPASTVGLMDYNLFINGSKFILGRYQTDKTFTAISGWQSATGFDINSFTGDPGFVNASGGDFRLAPGSVAEGAGRVGGIATGTRVNMGAYPSGAGIVGLIPDLQRPRAPVLVELK